VDECFLGQSVTRLKADYDLTGPKTGWFRLGYEVVTKSVTAVFPSFRVATSIITEAGLSYLGFGVQPPTPTWGNMLKNAQTFMTRAPWVAIFPGLLIFIAVIAINFIGDGLRDALDPYKVQ